MNVFQKFIILFVAFIMFVKILRQSFLLLLVEALAHLTPNHLTHFNPVLGKMLHLLKG